MKISILTDRTETIRASVPDVQFTLVLAVVLVVMVIFVFLRKFWATVIPSVALPLTLIGTFGIMKLVGLQPGQPLADGPDHRDGVRGG